jgi:hypothetical protein
VTITNAMCNQFKVDCLNGVHQPGDTYKIALYLDATATLNKSTTAYTSTGEVAATGGYTAGGVALSGFAVALSGDTGYMSFTDPAISSATITADGALVYNSSRSNTAMCAIKFTNAPVTSTNGTFTVDLPAAGASALLRFA